MDIIINALAILMGILGFFVFVSGILGKHFGIILGGIVYSIGAYFAFVTSSFIPLIIAFVVVVVLRKIGFDPSFGHKEMSDKEILEKAWPKDIKKEYTLDEVKRGIRDLGKRKETS